MLKNWVNATFIVILSVMYFGYFYVTDKKAKVVDARLAVLEGVAAKVPEQITFAANAVEEKVKATDAKLEAQDQRYKADIQTLNGWIALVNGQTGIGQAAASPPAAAPAKPMVAKTEKRKK